MNKFNVYVTAIVGATVILVSAVWGTVTVLSSREYGLFDYLMHAVHTSPR